MIMYIEIGGIGIMRWDCPKELERNHFPASKSFALYGTKLVQMFYIYLNFFILRVLIINFRET